MKSTTRRLAQFLSAKKFILASRHGVAVNSYPDYQCIGILQKDHSQKPQKRLFNRTNYAPRKKFLGVIWFGKDTWIKRLFTLLLLGVYNKDEKNWLFKVYGEENLPLFRELAVEMVKEFGVTISIYCADKKNREERFLLDSQ